MHSKVFVYRVECPDCGTVQYGFVGDNESGSFYCGEKIKMIRGGKEGVIVCEYTSEKLHHLPLGHCKLINTIEIGDVVKDLKK